MPFVVCLLSCLLRFLVQKIQFTAPMYIESHWVSGDVHDEFKRSHIRVARESILFAPYADIYAVTPSPTMRDFGGRTSM